MVTWEEVSETWSREQWDRSLGAAEDRNVFQTYAWGEYKRTSGWLPSRWAAKGSGPASGDGPVAMVQLLCKSFPGTVKVAWAPGGPVHQFPRSADCDLAEVLASMRDRCGIGTGLSYGRLCSYRPGTDALDALFGRIFRKPGVTLTSGHTVRLDLTRTLDQLMGGMKAKHRYYVKQALAERIDWVAGNDAGMVGEFARLYEEMAGRKGLRLAASSLEDLIRLRESLGERLLIVAGLADGRMTTACLVLIFNGKAFYWRAATDPAGREVSASYAMVYLLLEQLQKLGVTELDLGGVVPGAEAMAGVNHFKQGFGGEPVRYLGEWEWAGSSWLRWGVNLAIRLWGDQI